MFSLFNRQPKGELKNFGENLPNREFLEKAIKYREECIKATGLDPFLPSPIVQPVVTEEEIKAAEAVAQAIKCALELTKQGEINNETI